MSPASTDIARPLPREVSALLLHYGRLQALWFGVHYVVGIIGTCAGIIVAAQNQPQLPAFLQAHAAGWGAVAAFATGVVTALGPLRRAEVYKYAYYRLGDAVQKYQELPETTKAWLIGEYTVAKRIVLTGVLTLDAKGDVLTGGRASGGPSLPADPTRP